jgi:uncharacterized protein YhaN
MRFSQLELLKYGHFDGCTLVFPESPIDLHVIFGRNEAGKSTAMSAISDLLFQFPNSTPFDFRHDKQLLRVGATLMRDGSTVTCRRKKGRSSTLLDAADEPLDEGVLAALLGGQTRESFLRMFSLDHSRLRDGGNAILQAKDDIGQAIFAAGSGLVSVTELQRKLDQEAKDIWGKRAASQTYHLAAKEYENAKDQQKKALIRPAAWIQLREQVTETKASLNELRKRRKGLEAERDTVERTRRILGPSATLRATRAELENLGSISDLPHDASSILSGALQDISLAEMQRSQETDRKRANEEESEGIVIEGNLLSRRAEIDALREGRGAVDNSLADLPRRRGELQTATANLRRLQTELGWAIEGAIETQARLPMQVGVAEVRGLLEMRSGLDGVMSTATKREEDAKAALQRAREALEGLAGESDTTTISAVLATAQAAGDLDVAIGNADRLVERERKELNKQFHQLLPWNGDVDDLEGLSLPSEGLVNETGARLKAYSDETSKERYALQKSIDNLARIELQQRQVAGETGAISPAQVSEARGSRDLTLSSIRDRVTTGNFKSEDAKDIDVLSGQIYHVDELTDQRFTGATQSTRLAAKIQEHEQALLEVDQHRAEVERLAAAELAAKQEWQENLSKLGFDLSPGEFAVWRSKRDSALQAARRVQDAKTEAELLKTKRSETSKQLLSEIGQIKPDHDLSEATSFNLILQVGLELKRAAELAGKERLRLETVRASASAEVDLAAQGKENAQDRLTAWSEQWTPAVKSIGLNPDSSIAVIRAQLVFLEDLRTQVKDMLSLEHRISGMEANVGKFKEAVWALVESCNIQTQETDDIRLMQELVRRSTNAAILSERKERLKDAIQESARLIESYDEKIELANAKIAPLLQTASAKDNNCLRAEIERCERARQLTIDIRALEREIVGQGEGLSVDTLLETSQDAEATSLREKSDDLKEQLDELAGEIEQMSADLAKFEVAFNSIDDGPSAVVAAADAELARASMSEEAERYLQKRCQALLLSWAVERYRVQKQAPLLKRASTLFATLTLDRFSKLIVSTEEGEPRLSGLTTDGEVVAVNGMSEGTVDQLFLALRIAAVEDEVAQGIRLPFLADDLLVNFDDRRAAAGFKVLSELARHTQVLFFTHHQHLITIAKSAVAPESISECFLQP